MAMARVLDLAAVGVGDPAVCSGNVQKNATYTPVRIMFVFCFFSLNDALID